MALDNNSIDSIYESLCLVLGIEEWSEMKEKLNSQNLQYVADAASALKEASDASKKAAEEYEIQPTRQLKETSNYAIRVYNETQQRLTVVLYGVIHGEEECVHWQEEYVDTN